MPYELPAELKAQIDAIMGNNDLRHAWLDDPVLNLCTSVGIEWAAARASRKHTAAWKEQIERYNAVLDALHRIAIDKPTHDGFAEVVVILTKQDVQPYKSAAWTVAVLFAAYMGIRPEGA